MSQEGLENETYDFQNEFLNWFGIQLNKNSVMKSSMVKYYHPKEVLIQQGVIQSDLVRCSINKENKQMELYQRNSEEENLVEDQNFQCLQGLTIVYPFGCTMKLKNQATALMCTGVTSYPHNECIFALYQNQNQGNLFVFGTWQIFSDEYFELEENQRLFQFILNQIGNNKNLKFKTDLNVNQEKFFSKQNIAPFLEGFADQLKNSYIQTEDLTLDFYERFNFDMPGNEMDLIPEICQAFEQMQIKQEKLKLIPPLFDTPLLGLSPAVFPPILFECDTPCLELFDLDDEFADPETKLADLTNKCNDDDLEYYIKSSAEILGLENKVNINNPNEVLFYVMEKLIQFKCGNMAN